MRRRRDSSISRYARNTICLTRMTVHACKRRLIDTFASAMGAYDEPLCQMARAIARRYTGTPGASVWGSDTQTAPEMAAFVNGTMVRYLDISDTYLGLGGGHPSDVIAGIIAVAEATRVRRRGGHQCGGAGLRRLLQPERCGGHWRTRVGSDAVCGARNRDRRRENVASFAGADGARGIARADAEHGVTTNAAGRSLELEGLCGCQRGAQRGVRGDSRAGRFHGAGGGVRGHSRACGMRWAASIGGCRRRVRRAW